MNKLRLGQVANKFEIDYKQNIDYFESRINKKYLESLSGERCVKLAVECKKI